MVVSSFKEPLFEVGFGAMLTAFAFCVSSTSRASAVLAHLRFVTGLFVKPF
jgi:hypothetical protein